MVLEIVDRVPVLRSNTRALELVLGPPKIAKHIVHQILNLSAYKFKQSISRMQRLKQVLCLSFSNSN